MGERAWLLLSVLLSSDPEPGTSEPSPPKPPVFFLRDSARVSGKLKLESIVVDTRYGRLHVPIGEAISVRVARRLSPEDRAQIERAIDELDSDDFEAREQATEDLKRFGVKARRHLLDAQRSKSDEVKARAELALEACRDAPARDPEAEESLEPLPETEEDELVTRRFTIRGKILDEKLSVETAYGPLELELKDLRGIVFRPAHDEARSLRVSPSHAAPDSWLNTRVSLTRGQKITIGARGQLQVPNYSLTSGPEGTTRYSGSGFPGFPMLSLVGKIGKNGKPFLVGREFKGKATRDGTLYLGIVPFRRNYAATGSFQVKLETKS